MKNLLALALLIAGVAYPATFAVCNSMPDTLHDGTACTHTTVNAAIAAANANDLIDGWDTILLKAGQTHANFIVPNGSYKIRIKSSRIDEWPRGYRICRNADGTTCPTGYNTLPLMATVSTASGTGTIIEVGEGRTFLSITEGSATATIGQVNDYAVGDKVVVDSADITPYWCSAGSDALFVSWNCVATNYDRWSVRTAQHTFPAMADNDVLCVRGQLPGMEAVTNLTSGQCYYVRDYGRILGTGTLSKDNGVIYFNLAATPGGSAITPTSAIDTNPVTGLLLEYPPYPIRSGDTLYITAKSPGAPHTIELSTTPGGTALTWPQVGTNYNGSIDAPGFRIWRPNPPEDIELDGLLITGATEDPYYGINIYSGSDPTFSPRRIHIKRVWVKGLDDQETLPQVGIRVGSTNSSVTDSIVTDVYSRDGDTQAISIAGFGEVTVENNELQAAGMSIMSGGGYSDFRYDRETITVRRNYGTKAKKWQANITLRRDSTTQFTVANQKASQGCFAQKASTNISDRCFWYTGDHLTYTRHDISPASAEITCTYTSGSGSGFGYFYGNPDGSLHLQHNMAAGTMACTPEVTVTYAATPVRPADATALGRMTVTSGTFPSGSAWDTPTRAVYSKNIFESKFGTNYLFEGNVMENAFIVNQAGNQQGMCINITSSGTDSGYGAANFNARSRYMLIQNNICRHSGEGVLAIGQGYDTLRAEIHGITYADTGTIMNNLFYDLGAKYYTYGSTQSATRLENGTNWKFDHNTGIDVPQIFYGSGFTGGCASSSCATMHYYRFSNNLMRPYLATLVGGAASTYLPNLNLHTYMAGSSWNTWVGAQTNYALDPATTTFTKNMLLNPNTYTSINTRPTHYPGSFGTATPSLIETYCVYHTDACRTLTPFTAFTERDVDTVNKPTNYVASNYRFTDTLANYPTTDGRLIGADIDEIEHWTGPMGDDVVVGRPKFADRIALRVKRTGSTTASISWQPEGPTSCTFKVWDNNQYADDGAPNILNLVVDTNDSGASVSNGRKTLTPTITTAAQYGKMWCGTAVAVFRIPAN